MIATPSVEDMVVAPWSIGPSVGATSQLTLASGSWETIFEALTKTFSLIASEVAPPASGVMAFLINTSAIARRRDLYQLLSTIVTACEYFKFPLDTVLGSYDTGPQLGAWGDSSGVRESVTRLIADSKSWALGRFVAAGIVSYVANAAFERDIITVAELSTLPRHVKFPPFIFEDDLGVFYGAVGQLWGLLRLHAGAGRTSVCSPLLARVFMRSTGQFMRCHFDSELFVQHGGRISYMVLTITGTEQPGDLAQLEGLCEHNESDVGHWHAGSPASLAASTFAYGATEAAVVSTDSYDDMPIAAVIADPFR
jgi:hypothetical protein